MRPLAPGERRPCTACGTPIIGARSSSNPKSVLPVVVEPHPNGNVLIQQKNGELVGFVIGNHMLRQQLLDLGVVMRISHFADCKHAGEFARPAG
jgi:hypothetical protein